MSESEENLLDMGIIINSIKVKDKNNKPDNNSVINRILELFKMNKIIFVLLIVFGGIIGQIITRVFYLDGSLDKWYLLIPPFTTSPISMYPGYLLYNDNICLLIDHQNSLYHLSNANKSFPDRKVANILNFVLCDQKF